MAMPFSFEENIKWVKKAIAKNVTDELRKQYDNISEEINIPSVGKESPLSSVTGQVREQLDKVPGLGKLLGKYVDETLADYDAALQTIRSEITSVTKKIHQQIAKFSQLLNENPQLLVEMVLRILKTLLIDCQLLEPVIDDIQKTATRLIESKLGLSDFEENYQLAIRYLSAALGNLSASRNSRVFFSDAKSDVKKAIEQLESVTFGGIKADIAKLTIYALVLSDKHKDISGWLDKLATFTAEFWSSFDNPLTSYINAFIKIINRIRQHMIEHSGILEKITYWINWLARLRLVYNLMNEQIAAIAVTFKKPSVSGIIQPIVDLAKVLRSPFDDLARNTKSFLIEIVRKAMGQQHNVEGCYSRLMNDVSQCRSFIHKWKTFNHKIPSSFGVIAAVTSQLINEGMNELADYISKGDVNKILSKKSQTPEERTVNEWIDRLCDIDKLIEFRGKVLG